MPLQKYDMIDINSIDAYIIIFLNSYLLASRPSPEAQPSV